MPSSRRKRILLANSRTQAERRPVSISNCACSLLLLAASIGVTDAATLFFGATSNLSPEESGNSAHSSSSTEAIGRRRAQDAAAFRPPAPAREAAAADAKLSDTELVSVYKFCTVLPLLQQQGELDPSDKSREVCERLVSLIRPHLRAPTKRRRNTRAHRHHPRKNAEDVTKRRKTRRNHEREDHQLPRESSELFVL